MAGDCILCGKCLEVCPLLAATDREELSPRAKADLVRLLDGDEALLRSEDVARLTSLCLGCHRCKSACSQGVDVPGMVAMLRGAHPDFKAWLWKTWLTHAKQLWSVSSTAAELIPESFQPEKFGPFLKMLAGMKGGAGLTPFLSVKAFPDTYRGQKMLLFAGCTATYVQQRWLHSARYLLDGLGVEILPADFQCCGSGLKGAGCAQEAASMEAHNLDIWRKAGRLPVVTFCSSCRDGLLSFEFTDAQEAAEWAESVIPLSIIAHLILFMISGNSPNKMGYHRPCHAKGVDDDLALLQGALGERLLPPSGKECCGFGGLMRLSAPELSGQVNSRCWQALEGPDVVLSSCSACVTQLAGTAPGGVKVGHWLEIIKAE